MAFLCNTAVEQNSEGEGNAEQHYGAQEKKWQCIDQRIADHRDKGTDAIDMPKALNNLNNPKMRLNSNKSAHEHTKSHRVRHVTEVRKME